MIGELLLSIPYKIEPNGSFIKSLPRKSKKNITVAFKDIKNNDYNVEINMDVFDKFRRIIETLLTGRVSESITAIAHGIQTPVQGAINDVEGLRTILDKYEENELLDRLSRNIDKIKYLTKRIPLLLTKEIKYNPSSLRMITVHRVIQEIANNIKPIADNRFIDIIVNYNSTGALRVEAVPDQIELAFNNIIENSVKYSFEGTIENRKYVDITFDSKDYFLIIKIKNLGILISQDEIQDNSIFQLGFRGKYSLDRGRQGTGSGLFIANRITEAHGGKITVTSEPREATEDIPRAVNIFSIYWPFDQNYSPHSPNGASAWFNTAVEG